MTLPIEFLILTIVYFVFVLIYFTLVQKPLFFAMDRACSLRPITWRDVRQVYAHGLRTDCIAAAYLSFIPLILATIRQIAGPAVNLPLLLAIYNVPLALAITLLCVADAVLYRFWQYKIEASVFHYLNNPREACASVSTLYLVAAFGGTFLFSSVYFVGAQLSGMLCSRIFPSEPQTAGAAAITIGLFLIAGGTLFLITRGLRIRPNNPSIAYYSSNPFLNHWALNPAFSLLYSLTTRESFNTQFRNFPPEECSRIVAPLFPVSGTPARRLLNTTRPNILLVVWESLGAEFVESLGGRPDVTPNLDRIAREGVIFTQCTAGSFRTDRGLVCLLSGYLGQPTTSIIRHTRKLPHLPALPRRLAREGYTTTAVHGGDLSIMHKSDYYIASGHDRLVSSACLPSDAPAGKWGIHDHWMFDWLLDDIADKTSKGERWFTTLQTLSSHEPFIVPYSRLSDPVDNSFAYVDDAFGRFIDKLRTTPAWKDLLVIVVADHGYNASHHPIDRKEYAHIPVIMTGGAVAAPAKIDTLMSQTDLAATLLGQLDLPHDEFIFSRDILADTYTEQFSLHTYNNGFLLTDLRGTTNFDNVADKAVSGSDPRRETMGKAILQTLYDDIESR